MLEALEHTTIRKCLMNVELNDVNILSHDLLPTPRDTKDQFPVDARCAEFVRGSRLLVGRILDRQDKRLIAEVGPCSIHALKAASEYACRLRDLAEDLQETMLVVMRVYLQNRVQRWVGRVLSMIPFSTTHSASTRA